MDLFAPCRNCLQCLPFFNPSPPAARATPPASDPAKSPSAPSSDASKATSVDPALASKDLPSPTPAVAPAAQQQDLCPPLKAEQQPEDAYSAIAESGAVPDAGIVIAPPVTSPHRSPPAHEDADDDKATNLPEIPLRVPYINDVTFPASGSLPVQSPATPAPFGPGYSANQYPPPPEYQFDTEQHKQAQQHVLEDPQPVDEKLNLDDESGQHGQSQSHHGHESHHNHVSPHHEHSHSHHGHDYSHHQLGNSEGGHVPPHSHVADYEVPHSDNSQATQELHKDASLRQDSQKQGNVSTSVDDVEESATEHIPFNTKIDHTSPTPHLEVSQSTPALDVEATIGAEISAGSHTNGAPALLEPYYSEPVAVVSEDLQDIDDVESPSELIAHGGSHVSGRRRRRDLLKTNFKGIKQQIKQGGLHLKEEGNKYMQTVIENVNKQAQQIEQSGSFFHASARRD